ncbi:MAG TPA: hypothetical protein VN645_04815, partial [Steroidobacteraceae bacterium]|nr:hypothetical protein [Steroidobacteraceae bacterium]
LVDGGSVQEFDGDLDDYARWLTRSNVASEPSPRVAEPSAAAAANASREAAQQRRRDSAEQRKALAPLKARLTRCDKRLQELAALAKTLDAQLADPAIYAGADRTRQMDLTVQRARVAQETEEVETEWLTLTDEIERASG